jgi:hypothetical protein
MVWSLSEEEMTLHVVHMKVSWSHVEDDTAAQRA